MNRIALSVAGLSLLIVSAPAMAEKKPPKTKGPTPVVVYEAAEEKFVDRVESIGTLRANETVTLASTITENVTAVNFEDGQRVKKGDILVEMTSAEEKALIDQQRALVNESSQQLNRAKELAKAGAASTSDLNERQREYSSAKSGMAALQSRLDDHIIVAPFDGVLGMRNISVGTLLQPGAMITTLDEDSVMKLDFAVPSVFLPALKPGMEIVAKAAGFKESFVGTVSSINSQIDENTRAVGVRAIIPNPDAKLKPGLLMTIELLKDPRQSVAIPEGAIIPEGRKTFVMVVDEAQKPPIVEKREVVIGARKPGEVEVVEHLKAGETIVVQGTMTAQAGKPVMIQAVQENGDTLQDILKKEKEAAAIAPAADAKKGN